MLELPKAKILIVDDLPDKLLVYQVILQDLELEIICAHSGAEALKQVLQHEFAVILLDVNMPVMDGFETAAIIRARRRSAHTPIIFVTALADEVRMTEGYACGAVDYILTPVVPEVLRAKVRVFVDLYRMTEQVRRQAEERIALLEERTKREAIEDVNQRLSYLVKAGSVIGQSLDYNDTARAVVRIAVPSLGDYVVVARSDSEGNNWLVMEGRDVGGKVEISESVGLQRLSEEFQDRLLTTLQHAESPNPPSTMSSRNRDEPDVLFMPLRARGRTFGVLVASRRDSHREFGPADVTTANALAARAVIALDNARLYKEVEHANQQKNEFLSMLAHELRNPLAPIRNAVTYMKLSGKADPELEWARDLIDRQVTHMVRLVDDLLDISRITRGQIRLELQPVDLGSVIESAVETSRPLIDAASHHLKVVFPDPPIQINADRARLSQVLSNLLNNAAKYTPDGGSVLISGERSGESALIRVRDDGVGIPPEMLAKVFDLFTQVDSSLDRSKGGLGVGLTLVKRLVELHNGHVDARSDGPGLGTQFTIRIPVVSSVPAPEESRQVSAVPQQFVPTQSLRILVVDDNVEAADSLTRLLNQIGHQVASAYDGISALDLARELQPQVVVLDLGLPGLSGFEVAKRLRQEFGSKVLLLALSGYGQEDDHRRSKQAGFDRHFNKPLDFDALMAALATAFPRPEPHLIPVDRTKNAGNGTPSYH